MSGTQGQSLTVAVTGTYTNFQQSSTTANFGPAIGVTSLTVTSPATVNVAIAIGALALTGPRSVTIRSGSTDFSFTFTVNASSARITAVAPASGARGQNLTVTVTGQDTHFAGGATSASFAGSGIAAGAVTVLSPTSATLPVAIDQAATAGPRTLRLTTGGEVASSTAGFTVTPGLTPSSYSSGNPLVTAATPKAEFEGPSSADFFNSINNPANPNSSLLANPQIAVGPDDIVMVANSQIWRLPNGNAPGVLPTGLNPGLALFAGQAFGAQRASLDSWIGATALAQLCPTGNTDPSGVIDSGNTRSSVTCQIDNATVTYDQMQGRFLVLFTVVDTGLTFNQALQIYAFTRPRKASWVLIVSQFGVLVDQACFQGTEAVAVPACPASTPPGAGPNPAGSFVFATPTPVAGTFTGSVNGSIWKIYYGNALGTGATDGFGSNKAHASVAWAGTVGVGNINSIPGIADAVGLTPDTKVFFDCSPSGIAVSGKLAAGIPAAVCYMPTGARLGVDNDTVTIASPVIDFNINGSDFGAVYNPVPGATFEIPGYAGTRIRVIKKTALYNFSPLVSGDQFNAATATRAAGSYYDLFTSPSNNGVPVDNSAANAANGGVNGPPIVFTAILQDTVCPNGSAPAGVTGLLGIVNCRFSPLFYEPAHLRGRAMAAFSNLPIPQNSQTYLLGAQAAAPGISTNILWLQGIREIYTGPFPANQFGPLPFYPVLQNGTSTAGGATPSQQGFPTAFVGSINLKTAVSRWHRRADQCFR
ncbi:MAG: hypothetical protein LAQ69_49750 [Acidobacteriia bacterium]|nr:hypothetical protein [Terriglobia bacterium]